MRWPIRTSPRSNHRSRRVSSETCLAFDDVDITTISWARRSRLVHHRPADHRALSAPVYAALAGRFRRERVLACSIVACGIAVALVIPVVELHAVNALLFLAIALEGFAQSAPKALNDALLPWLADSPAQLVRRMRSRLFSRLPAYRPVPECRGGDLFFWHVRGIDDRRGALRLGAWPLFAIRGIDTRVGNDGSRVLTELAGGIRVLRRSPNARVVIVVMHSPRH